MMDEIIVTLRRYGISSVDELKEAIAKSEGLDLSIFTGGNESEN